MTTDYVHLNSRRFEGCLFNGGCRSLMVLSALLESHHLFLDFREEVFFMFCLGVGALATKARILCLDSLYSMVA